MLRFTQEQQALVNNQRRQHYLNHSAMVSQYGSGPLIGNASPLPKDVWGMWDREAVELQRTLLPVFNDLAASVSMPMPIGKLVHHFMRGSDSGTVNISLDGRSKARTDQQLYDYVGTALPLIDSSFSYTWRQVLAAQTEGVQLDPLGRDNANRRILEKLESLVLSGDTSIVVGGVPLYGLRTHPKRNTRTTGVTLNGATGAQWLTEIVATLKKLHDANFKTPATLYLNWSDWFYAGATEFIANYSKTILQRVMELPGIAAIVPGNSINANEIIGVIKDRRVLQVLNGMPMSTRALFRANPEDDYNFNTIAAASLEIKYDYNDQCGVVVST